MPKPPDPGPRNLPALITLAVLALLALGAWLAFPAVQSYIAFQDCVGTGRANCAPHSLPNGGT